MRVALEAMDVRTFKIVVERGGVAMSWAEVVAGWVDEASLRTAMIEAIAGVGFAAVYWEARSVAPEDRDREFEAVVIDAPELAREAADVRSFLTPLAGARAPAVGCFANLSGDAELVVPAPGEVKQGYPHLAAFLRAAPEEQKHALLKVLGAAVERWLRERRTRVWVSTAGLGVPWLHVRLDSRPKYFKWAAYR